MKAEATSSEPTPTPRTSQHPTVLTSPGPGAPGASPLRRERGARDTALLPAPSLLSQVDGPVRGPRMCADGRDGRVKGEAASAVGPRGDLDSPACRTSGLEGRQGLPAPPSCRSQPGRPGRRAGSKALPPLPPLRAEGSEWDHMNRGEKKKSLFLSNKEFLEHYLGVGVKPCSWEGQSLASPGASQATARSTEHTRSPSLASHWSRSPASKLPQLRPPLALPLPYRLERTPLSRLY